MKLDIYFKAKKQILIVFSTLQMEADNVIIFTYKQIQNCIEFETLYLEKN